MEIIKARYNKKNLTFALCMAWISAERWLEVSDKIMTYYLEGKITKQQRDILDYRCLCRFANPSLY